ncbi:LuxR C-terminal-related transcriptional regulator [Variovorax sp. HW608]|uniref:LuxR C-terminal-related transcriptional regulator n=1 Tax=Variovorax sp. HW608 TaxID=1034889 RepID=UPI001E316F4D|nr:LuxR C-terminal-related transcriptional regulator [Variovorax sp. HW608]
MPRDLYARPRLLSSAEPFRDRPVVLIQAPGGFGKTSLLAQWRREHLAHGTVVAWFSAQPFDEPQRLVHALVLAFRTGSGRPTFGHTLLDASAPGGLEAITIWLAEVAQSALSTVLIIDEADRLPEASRELLAYLLRNLPPNLRLVIAARADCSFGVDDLIHYGLCVTVGAPMLRFQVDETLQLVRNRFGKRVSDAAAVQLHEFTEGWPLGLQLALSIIAAGQEPAATISSISAHAGEPGDRFVPVMLANLPAADVEFLTGIAILDPLHPELCRAVTEDAAAAERLGRLSRETPIFVAAEYGDWMRMHTLARKALRRRFDALPAERRSLLHTRAADWLDAHGLVEAAAGHALSAGQRDKAYDLAERSLYEAFSRGRQAAVLEWWARLPDEELERRPRLLLTAAWSLALSERHSKAGGLVSRLLAHPGADDALRCECAMISSGAAMFADEPDRFAELHDPWSQNPPLSDPLLLHVHANRSALRALLDGEPGLARLRVQEAPRGDIDGALSHIRRWSEFFVGLSYLWEGQVRLAEELMQPTLAAVEADLGRRSPFTCMLASLLASALLERDRLGDAASALANRLDVLEHVGLPETLLLGFRTLARIALAEGAESRATELLVEMHSVGLSRGMPRLCIASLVDQIRMHARSFRSETCRDLRQRLDEAMAADSVRNRGPLWHRSVDVLVELGRGYAAIADQDWKGALQALELAQALSRRMKLGRLTIELMGLRALALDRRGEQSHPLILEAASLADSSGLVRVFQDAHPALADLVRDVRHRAGGRLATGAGPLAVPTGTKPEPSAPATPPSLALTPKEREVLALLARNLTNKEIGLALQTGDQTIKWHVKNLMAKLDTGSRKQVVQRARILGLLEAAA